jgi:hypothetical protein
MRTFVLVCVVALVVAVGVAYAVGLVGVTGNHQDAKYTLNLTLDTTVIQRGFGASASATPPSDPGAELNLLEVKGKIMEVRPTKGELVVSENVKSWTFQAKDAKVVLNDRDSKLADLKAGDDAAVTFDRQGDQMLATLVRVTRK